MAPARVCVGGAMFVGESGDSVASAALRGRDEYGMIPAKKCVALRCA